MGEQMPQWAALDPGIAGSMQSGSGQWTGGLWRAPEVRTSTQGQQHGIPLAAMAVWLD